MTALRTAVRAAALVALAALGGAAAAQPTLAPLDGAGPGPVYRVTIDGMIDNALAQYVERALADAEEAEAAAVVFRIDTFGGLLDAADVIRKAVLASPVPTVAVIDRNAASAGALIAYANDRIVFVPGASMGAATAVSQTGEYAPEKIQSYTRGLMRATAEAMVDERIEIAGVVDDSTLLTVSSDEALRLGVADAVLPSADAAVDALGLADRDQVAHEASRAEQVLRFLGSPVMASLLMMMMLGGLYFEIQTPGVGFAGSIALVGAALFFAPHYLLGLVQAWEIALFAVGIGLILVEVFVTPGFGVFGIAGLVATVGALLIALVPNIGFEFPGTGEIAQATTTLAAALVLVVLLAVSLGRLLPKSERMNRLVLAPTLSSVDGFTSADTVATLVGQRGRTLTGLRPSGTVEVGGVRVDVVSEGPFVAPGADVEVVSAAGSRVVVREVAA